MKPNLFLYEETSGFFNLFLSEISTLDCLKYIEPDVSLEVTIFGATLYHNYGYATEEDIPKLATVNELCLFLESEQDIGLVEFEAKLNNVGTLRTDDEKAKFAFESKVFCLAYLQKILPIEYSGLIINSLLNNQGMYISYNSLGKISKYPASKDYRY